MAHWLMKSEPESYSWDDLVRDRSTEWDGVRNPAAAINLRAMKVGDTALFYHSGKQKAAVGVMAITRAARPDGPDGKFASVEVGVDKPLPAPVTLAAMKADKRLSAMPTLRQSRLSVSPVSDAEWAVLMEMAKG
jgi:predicted RNA-binding protein with PUA-like domain